MTIRGDRLDVGPAPIAPSVSQFRWLGLGLLAILAMGLEPVAAHDIPNARVDRATQVTVEPGRLRIDYEVSLSELTLTQELRSLVEALPEASDRQGWLSAYGQVTGPMNGKGFLVTFEQAQMRLNFTGFDLAVEEHPRYTFHYVADLPGGSGRLSVDDTNFATSEGTCRLAIRGVRVSLIGDALPTDVTSIPTRELWQLSDEEEQRTHRVSVELGKSGVTPSQPAIPARGTPIPAKSAQKSETTGRLTRLLDRGAGLPSVLLGFLAFGLGAAHAIQPGHGKTLVAATAISGRGRGGWVRAALLGAITTATHTGSVLAIALGFWWTGSRQFGAVHQWLSRTAGFAIASIGLWRLGRVLGGLSFHDAEPGTANPVAESTRGLIGLGVAGGLVPCWDAVGLVMISAAVGRLGLGLWLVLTFSLGMGSVLVAIGWGATRLRSGVRSRIDGERWERRVGLASGLVLSVLGVYLLEH